MPSYLTVNCSYCGEETKKLLKSVNEAKKNCRRLFCSKRCLAAARFTSIKTNCGTCSKTIQRTPSQMKSSKSGNVYCSRTCATIMNNAKYKSQEGNGNYTNGVGSYRKRAIETFGPKCWACNYRNEQILQVHHMDGDRTNNDIKNLAVVCPTHHAEAHHGIICIMDYLPVDSVVW